MQQDGSCTGMAYLSGFRPLGWWFGNYFGVRKEQRAGSRALDFWEHMAEKCRQILPGAHGAIFETERYRDQDIESALKKFELRRAGHSAPLTEDERYSVTAALRIAIYTSRGVSHHPRGALLMAATDARARHPVEYVQPAMQSPFDRSNEVPLWPMVLPFATTVAKMHSRNEYLMRPEAVEEIVEFLYRVFRYAYSKEDPAASEGLPSHEGYAEYLDEWRSKLQVRLAGKRIVLTNRGILSAAVHRLLGRYGRDIDDEEIG